MQCVCVSMCAKSAVIGKSGYFCLCLRSLLCPLVLSQLQTLTSSSPSNKPSGLFPAQGRPTLSFQTLYTTFQHHPSSRSRADVKFCSGNVSQVFLSPTFRHTIFCFNLLLCCTSASSSHYPCFFCLSLTNCGCMDSHQGQP